MGGDFVIRVSSFIRHSGWVIRYSGLGCPRYPRTNQKQPGMMPWRSKSYEVLPALAVRGPDLRKCLRIATVSWMYGSAWAVLVSGVQLKSFARMVGFSDFDLGLLAAAPPLATLGMIVAALWIERSGRRKAQFLACATVHRLLWLAIAALPLAMDLPSRSAVYVMLGIYTLSWVMQSFANPAWMTWMGDLVPKRIRGRYFAARFGFGRIIQVALVVTIGLLLDYATVPGPETADAQPRLLLLICGIFAVGAILGAAEILMYRKVREVIPPSRQKGDEEELRLDQDIPRGRGLLATSRAMVRHILLEPLRNAMFRRYVAFGITIGFATAVPGFFFLVYTTETLGFSKLATQVLYMVISPILGMIGLKVWGQLLDRWGRRPVLIGATFMTVFSVTPYFFSTRDTPWPRFITDAANAMARWLGPYLGHADWVWITPDMPVGAYLVVCCSVLIGGIGWTGVLMGQNNVMLSFSDLPGRNRYVASAQVLVSIGSILGAPIGGLVVSFIDHHWAQANPLTGALVAPVLHVGPFLWTSYHATFALSGLARFAALLWLIGMPDPGAGTMRAMVRSVGLIAYSNASNWFLYPFRTILRRGERQGTDNHRGHREH